MAKEIWISSVSEKEVGLLFVADIVTAGGTVALDKDGANVVHSPSSGLDPDLVTAMQADIDGAAWLAALDAGTALYWTSNYVPVPGETGPQALAKVRSLYVAQVSVEINKYTTLYKYRDRLYQGFDAS